MSRSSYCSLVTRGIPPYIERMAATTEAVNGTTESAQMRISTMIRAHMAASGELQADLARVLHVGQETVSRILSGKRKLTVDELEAIAEHYGRHPGDFFDGWGQNRKEMTVADLRLVSGGAEIAPGQLALPFPPLRLVE